MGMELVAAILTVASNVAKVKPPLESELHKLGNDREYAVKVYREILEELEAGKKPAPSGNKPDEMQLKLYDMAVEQLHKYVTVFWQFPLALLAANFLASDKFVRHPKIMFGVSLVDCVFVYAFHRLVKNADVIILACQRAEDFFKTTDYEAFIPKFEPPKFPAPHVTVCALWALAIGLALFSGIKSFCP